MKNLIAYLRTQLERLEDSMKGISRLKEYFTRLPRPTLTEEHLIDYLEAIIEDETNETNTQLKTEESNQAQLHGVSTTLGSQGSVSEREECGSSSTPDDLHGHPGLFRGQREGTLHSGSSTTIALLTTKYVYRPLHSSLGLYSPVLPEREFANHQGGSLYLHS